ncbi:MAG: hypothetical protein LBH28_00645, partial [Oscillospiraceae bacterium]|jgi:hypothetical protein|nr:hypothetical protein [Oscillospiraceae bacterium]
LKYSSEEYEVCYYTLPLGTFDRIRSVLTDYSAEHSGAAIDTEGVLNFSLNGIIRFTLSEEPVSFAEIILEDLRDLAADWELGLWQPYVAPEGVDSSTNPASIIRGVEFEGNTGIDRVYISTRIINDVPVVVMSSYLGVVNYKVPENVYQTIERQYESFKEEYYAKK